MPADSLISTDRKKSKTAKMHWERAQLTKCLLCKQRVSAQSPESTGTVLCTSRPSGGVAETDRFLGLANQPARTTPSKRETLSENKVNGS